jgi:hypothetical protein
MVVHLHHAADASLVDEANELGFGVRHRRCAEHRRRSNVSLRSTACTTIGSGWFCGSPSGAVSAPIV